LKVKGFPNAWARRSVHLNPKFVDRKHFETTAMQKRTEITIETERVLVVSQRREKAILWCSDCDTRVSMLTVDEAALAISTTPVVIFKLAAAGKLHFAARDGRQFICPNSLAPVLAEGRR
jgi:hypothetical protein